MKAKGTFHPESGVHTLRHTFLTEMGELTDPYTLQRIAGHSNITTTMRYVHPQKRAMQSAFEKLFQKQQRKKEEALIYEVVLDVGQWCQLQCGHAVALRLPSGTTELRLKSTQISPPTFVGSPQGEEHVEK
jgi:hypothetical protein